MIFHNFHNNDNKLKENQYYSYNFSSLPKGCQYCVRGEKLVLFVTGICPRRCSFCPVSDEKYQKDLSFANERIIHSDQDLLNEAESMKAKGAGITGGDPLTRLDRALDYIRLLKKRYGPHFHLHLYTSLDLIDEQKLALLHQAGLDEIRFHLDLNDQKFWKRLELAKRFSWEIGVEIPLLPDKEAETRELLNFIEGKVDFLNLNELEIADNQQSTLLAQGLQTKDQLSYAVRGSLELGLKLLEHLKSKNPSYAVHLCTAKLKDAIQLGNRLKRQAKYSKRMFDHLTEDGLFVRGALYLPELAPGFDYRNLLKRDNSNLLAKLKLLEAKIKCDLHLNEREIFLDQNKPRILLSKKNLISRQKYFSGLGLKPAIVTEYPTADQLEIEVEFL